MNTFDRAWCCCWAHPDAVKDDVSRAWDLVIDVGPMHARLVIADIMFIKQACILVRASAAWGARCDLWQIHDRCLAHIADAIPLLQHKTPVSRNMWPSLRKKIGGAPVGLVKK